MIHSKPIGDLFKNLPMATLFFFFERERERERERIYVALAALKLARICLPLFLKC
jgi:hypothetical protein